ncbi:unnamed protein product [Caretta caretta]
MDYNWYENWGCAVDQPSTSQRHKSKKTPRLHRSPLFSFPQQNLVSYHPRKGTARFRTNYSLLNLQILKFFTTGNGMNAQERT